MNLQNRNEIPSSTNKQCERDRNKIKVSNTETCVSECNRKYFVTTLMVAQVVNSNNAPSSSPFVIEEESSKKKSRECVVSSQLEFYSIHIEAKVKST
jgi:hypothetical protein